MKILKRPDHIVFDTENPDKMKFGHVEKWWELKPLNQVTGISDMEFLVMKFPDIPGAIHPVFRDFGKSYYYAIEEK